MSNSPSEIHCNALCTEPLTAPRGRLSKSYLIFESVLLAPSQKGPSKTNRLSNQRQPTMAPPVPAPNEHELASIQLELEALKLKNETLKAQFAEQKSKPSRTINDWSPRNEELQAMLVQQIRLCKPLMNIGAATRLLFLEQSRDAILRTESHAAREAKRIFGLATSRANLVADASLFGCGYLEGADAKRCGLRFTESGSGRTWLVIPLCARLEILIAWRWIACFWGLRWSQSSTTFPGRRLRFRIRQRWS